MLTLVRSGRQETMCHDAIKLRALNMLTILS